MQIAKTIISAAIVTALVASAPAAAGPLSATPGSEATVGAGAIELVGGGGRHHRDRGRDRDRGDHHRGHDRDRYHGRHHGYRGGVAFSYGRDCWVEWTERWSPRRNRYVVYKTTVCG